MKSYNWLFALIAVIFTLGLMVNTIVTNNRMTEVAEIVR
jgi:hypothetical protein